MDSALVKASTAVNQIEGSLPELAATPMLIEMSPDMMATQYVAVDSQGMDVYELSALVEDTVLPGWSGWTAWPASAPLASWSRRWR